MSAWSGGDLIYKNLIGGSETRELMKWGKFEEEWPVPERPRFKQAPKKR